MGAIGGNKQGLKVLVAGSILQLFLGIIYVWSVFVKPVGEYFTWDIANVKLTSSYMLGFFVVGILIGGKLLPKIGASAAALAGGLLMSAGMLATSFIPLENPWVIYITYGVVGGFGVGMAYNAIITAAQKSFPKNRGFATGVSVCAFGLSAVVFAPLVETLVGKFGLQNTFRLLAAAFFIAVAALFSFVKEPKASGSASTVMKTDKKQFKTGEILKTKEFYFITMSLMLGTAAYFILNPSFKTMAADMGHSSLGTVIVMLAGISNAIGRLVVPFVSDKIGRNRAALGILLVTAVCAVALCISQIAVFMVVVALIAFCYGGYSGIYPVITADYFGIQNVGSNYGAVMVGFAASALASPYLISGIENSTVKFVTLAVLAALGGLLALLLIKFGKKEN